MKVMFEDKTVVDIYPSNRNIHEVHAIIKACKALCFALLDDLHLKTEEDGDGCLRFFSGGKEIARYTPGKREWEVF